LHNKPAGGGAAEAYASGPGSEEEEEEEEEVWNTALIFQWLYTKYNSCCTDSIHIRPLIHTGPPYVLCRDKINAPVDYIKLKL
jgi:hypothetical protein